MPEIEIEGEKTVADTDIAADVCELLMEQTIRNHQALMHDSGANEQNVHNILNNTSVKKYNEVDPIQAAAVEKVLGNSKVGP